jgi:molybdopterin synthase catalytic subunit
VIVGTPHRSDAFEAARRALDMVKATVPIWKRETWAEGSDWGQNPVPIVDVTDL